MKTLLLISIILLAGRVACGQVSATPSISASPPCRAGTLDLRASTDEGDAIGITYCVAIANIFDIGGTTLTARAAGFIDCGALSGDKAKPAKGAKPQSTNSQDSCENLYSWGLNLSNNYDWLASYDSLKKYIDSCANTLGSYRAFNLMSLDVSRLTATDTAIWSDYQLWLRSVLYLNTIDPQYFCSCVEQVGPWVYYSQAYIPPNSPGQLYMYKGDTGYIVLNWIINNTFCDTPFEANLYHQSRLSDSEEWQQYQSEGYHYPDDTTIPPLSTFGLDTLLDRHFLYASVELSSSAANIILNATASPNPVSAGTIITFGISQEAYVKINLFDILGNPVSGDRVPGSDGEGFEGLFEQGNHEVPLSLQGIPSGTYFARILTAYGNVATVKLVKE